MARKLIDKVMTGNAMVKTYHDSDYSEYVCVLYVGGIKQKDADYFTTCKADALATAIAMSYQAMGVAA